MMEEPSSAHPVDTQIPTEASLKISEFARNKFSKGSDADDELSPSQPDKINVNALLQESQNNNLEAMINEINDDIPSIEPINSPSEVESPSPHPPESPIEIPNAADNILIPPRSKSTIEDAIDSMSEVSLSSKKKSKLTSLSHTDLMSISTDSSPPLPATPSLPDLAKPAPFGNCKKDWLLRLFESEFFSLHLAIGYICQYIDSPGIQNYLCDRIWTNIHLREIVFYIPQLTHLVLHGYEKSSGEEFISVLYLLMRIARRCRHSAMMILWSLENYWNENPSNPRINYLLYQFQAAIFGAKHVKPTTSVDYSHLKGLPSAEISLVGFGVMLAGGIIAPEFVDKMSSLVLLKTGILEPYDILIQETPNLSRCSSLNLHRRESTVSYSISPSVEELHMGKAFGKTFKQIISTIKQKTSSPSNAALAHQQAPNKTVQNVFMYTGEMQFVVSLIDISKRMFKVEKKSRKRTLTAELNIINNSLPAVVCLPLWCNAEEDYHDVIVRIVPEEATTLNSAERVPLLLFIEILEAVDCQKSLEELVKLKNITPSLSPSPSNVAQSESQNGSDIGDEKASTSSGAFLPPPSSVSADSDYGERMRTAAIMLAQLSRQASEPKSDKASIENIRARLIVEMETIERQQQDQQSRTDSNLSLGYVIDSETNKIRDDPSAAALSEDWELKASRIRANSPFGALEGWKLVSVIAKTGTDMRQEHLACQIIEIMADIWERDELDLWVKPLRILVSGEGGGLVETVPNSLSIHSIRKRGIAESSKDLYTLRDHFLRAFGPADSPDYLTAVDGFVSSLAGYSLVTFILSLKDRHNGNILVDSHGHLVHIDFGFMLGNAPGGNYVTFETAPFKLTSEYIDLLNSVPGAFDQFKQRFLQGFLALRKSHEQLELPIRILLKNSKLPALQSVTYGLEQMKNRLVLVMSNKQVETFVERLITSSAQNMFTRLYDTYQYYSNGIL
jgi:phosphatidylinositol 4-kinase B